MVDSGFNGEEVDGVVEVTDKDGDVGCGWSATFAQYHEWFSIPLYISLQIIEQFSASERMCFAAYSSMAVSCKSRCYDSSSCELLVFTYE